jgi:AraC-type DNA-binding domain-containing proteins
VKNSSVYDNTYCGFFVEHLNIKNDTPLMKSSHYHDFYEIYYFLGDSMNYFVGDKNYVLEKNNILLIDKYAYHKTTYNKISENERVLIEFNEDVFNIISDKQVINKIINLFKVSNKIIPGSSEEVYKIHSIIFKLVGNFYSKTQYGLTLAKLNLVELCLALAEIAEGRKVCNTAENINQKESTNNVVEIIKYINENFSSKITLDILVEKFFVNKYYLCHVFKNETGLSIIDFVNGKRLAEAEKLIRYSEQSITEICYKIGFSSMNHFLKLFKYVYNITPKKLRADVKKQSGKK